MGIVERAAKLAADERTARDRKANAERLEHEREEALVNRVNKKVTELLLAEVNGQRGFSLADDHLKGRKVLRLDHDGATLGFVVVEGRTYQFRGSDEVQPDDLWHVVIDLWDAVAARSRASASVDSDEHVERGVANFSDSLANFLKDHVR